MRSASQLHVQAPLVLSPFSNVPTSEALAVKLGVVSRFTRALLSFEVVSFLRGMGDTPQPALSTGIGYHKKKDKKRS